MAYPMVNLPLNGLIQNIWALCVGDFNTSFNPSLQNKTASNTVDLIYTGNQQVTGNQEFELPIRSVNANNVGAVSLILNFPANLIDVEDIMLNGAGGQLNWAVNGNELRIGWYSDIPLNLNASDVLLTLKLKTKDVTAGSDLSFTLASNPLNELADAQYDVISNAILSIDAVNTVALGVQEQAVSNDFNLNNYPNPFNGTTLISYNLPYDGKVKLELYDYIGSLVKVLADEDQLKGNHSVKLDDAGLPTGVYTATLRVKNGNNTLIRTIRIVNIR